MNFVGGITVPNLTEPHESRTTMIDATYDQLAVLRGRDEVTGVSRPVHGVNLAEVT